MKKARKTIRVAIRLRFLDGKKRELERMEQGAEDMGEKKGKNKKTIKTRPWILWSFYSQDDEAIILSWILRYAQNDELGSR